MFRSLILILPVLLLLLLLRRRRRRLWTAHLAGELEEVHEQEAQS